MKPTETEIRETIAIIQEKLKSLPMRRKINTAVRQGYEMAVTILAEGNEDYRAGEKLTYLQSRTITSLAADYLKGDASQKFFLAYFPEEKPKTA